ncbi:MAG: phosphoribosylformimino-5-aminoimidazole carboxamide ribotide isomerase [Lachnospiraceae bacterium]|nr:phosphoribosylformimino-5-aminoimidazole carboxamide ribotide isomerase [Lachnospiraceae bacterium]
MRFRPCIDIHNGKVKQIVGGSLLDKGDQAVDNYVSDYDGAYYAKLYKDKGLTGGHAIILNPASSDFYAEDLRQAKLALSAFPNGLMIGGGVNADNAKDFIDSGASHVIVTSYVFKDGKVDLDRLNAMVNAVGKEHLTLDFSCRIRDGRYYIVTDRWQKFTDTLVNLETLKEYSSMADEFLIHGVDVEGKASGVDSDLLDILAAFDECPVTYAGGVGSYEDIKKIKAIGQDKIDLTIGSALDLFGGELDFDEVLRICKE